MQKYRKNHCQDIREFSVFLKALFPPNHFLKNQQTQKKPFLDFISIPKSFSQLRQTQSRNSSHLLSLAFLHYINKDIHFGKEKRMLWSLIFNSCLIVRGINFLMSIFLLISIFSHFNEVFLSMWAYLCSWASSNKIFYFPPIFSKLFKT